MDTGKLIPVNTFCIHHNIETSFVDELSHFGLIEIVRVEQDSFIDEEHVHELERFLRLHQELDINLEGMDAISHLLHRLAEMQDQLTALRNKLRLYENPD